MPGLFLSNFEFEDQLANRKSNPAILTSLRHSLATSWLPLAMPGDALFEITSTGDVARSIEAPEIQLPIVGSDRLQQLGGYKLIPWGWSEQAVQFGEKHNLECLHPEVDIVRKVNDRAFSFAFEKRNNIGLPGMSSITSAEEFVEAVEQCLANGPDKVQQRWIVKPAFSSSARHCLRGFGRPTSQHLSWVEKRISEIAGWAGSAEPVLYFEPFVERLSEAGLQFTITEEDVVYEGCAELFNDRNGQYRGSVATPDSSTSIWRECEELAEQAAREIAETGYRGPVGIDCMQYRANDGDIRFRAIQDVNARWTMGRIAIESLRFAEKSESVAMFHCSDAERNALLHSTFKQFAGARVIRSSDDNGSCVKSTVWVALPEISPINNRRILLDSVFN